MPTAIPKPTTTPRAMLPPKAFKLMNISPNQAVIVKTGNISKLINLKTFPEIALNERQIPAMVSAVRHTPIIKSVKSAGDSLIPSKNNNIFPSKKFTK